MLTMLTMRTILMWLAFASVWGAGMWFVLLVLGRLFRVNIQSDENRTRQLMRRGVRLDISQALRRGGR